MVMVLFAFTGLYSYIGLTEKNLNLILGGSFLIFLYLFFPRSKKRNVASTKQLISEYTEGMNHVQEFSDGSTIISHNKDPGSINDVHYTGYVDKVKKLKRDNKNVEAIELLLKLVEATEKESKVAREGWGVAPWYYEQLAIIYRKEKRFQDEVSILERYQRQVKAPGVGPNKLKERLKKAKQNACKNDY